MSIRIIISGTSVPMSTGPSERHRAHLVGLLEAAEEEQRLQPDLLRLRLAAGTIGG
ncbi:MAG: hypothetical protein V9H26_08095 [Verrucomicrobiota bacterium]